MSNPEHGLPLPTWEHTEAGANAKASENLERGHLAFAVVAGMVAEALGLNLPGANDDRRNLLKQLHDAARSGAFPVVRWGVGVPLPPAEVAISDLAQSVSVYDVLRWYERTSRDKRVLSLKHPGRDSLYSLPEPGASLPTRPAQPAVERVAAGLSGKGLCKKYGNKWPTLERDLKRATENGLRAEAAVSGRRGWWYEEKAIAWAEARGKLALVPAISGAWQSRVHRAPG